MASADWPFGVFNFFCNILCVNHVDQLIYNKGLGEWLLFNAKWTIFQPYHGQNKFDEMMMSAKYYTNTLSSDLYSVTTLKQLSAGKQVTPLGHIILVNRSLHSDTLSW